MSYRTEITYWSKEKDSEGEVVEIDLLSTPSTKVPEIGEEIHISNEFDEEWANFNDLEKKLFPNKEKIVRSYYKVVSVKRYIKVMYVPKHIEDMFFNNITTGTKSGKRYPQPITTETFEVFLEKIEK